MLVDPGLREGVEVGHLDSIDQLHREDAPGAQVAVDARNHDVGPLGEVGGDNLAVARLVDEVELHRDVLQDFARDDAKIEIGLDPGEQAQREFEVAQIGINNRLDARILDLYGTSAAIERTRGVDLGERCGGDRHRVELGKSGFERPSQLTLDLSANRFEGARRYAILQAGERRDPFVRQHIGASCDKLARLDQQALEANRGAIKRARSVEVLATIARFLAAVPGQARP